jgi:alkanesulfonate monooxygenase SsuD/methylene tetrahydromethanopterin reductase-like flavin-dependent oxidoreductase (luciferase family)
LPDRCARWRRRSPTTAAGVRRSERRSDLHDPERPDRREGTIEDIRKEFVANGRRASDGLFFVSENVVVASTEEEAKPKRAEFEEYRSPEFNPNASTPSAAGGQPMEPARCSLRSMVDVADRLRTATKPSLGNQRQVAAGIDDLEIAASGFIDRLQHARLMRLARPDPDGRARGSRPPAQHRGDCRRVVDSAAQ